MNSVADLDLYKLVHALALKTCSANQAFPRAGPFSLGDQNGARPRDHFDVLRILKR